MSSHVAARLISVVICVYSDARWNDVLAAVESVRRQSLPPHEIIVVVDHNPSLFSRLRAALTDVVVVENRFERGLSGGKNTGIGIAAGEVVAFLDDDAVADVGWLENLSGGYRDAAVVGVGGLTLPKWEAGRPAWFPREFDWTVGCTFVGRHPGRVRNLLGGNASFRREVFDAVGGFPSHIGRTTTSRRPLGCEETEFCIRLSQRLPGSVLVFEPGAVIHHKVSTTRSTFRYFRSRCYAEGLSKAKVTRSVGIADGLSSERTYVAVTLPRGSIRGVSDALHGEPSGLARSGAIVVGLACTTAGYAIGTLGSLRDRAVVGGRR